jgi:hypothetical protein
MLHMLIAHELEETPDQIPSQTLKVKLQTRVLEIHHASLGLDFLIGSYQSSLYLLPLSSILEISGLENMAVRQVSFEQILSAQQQPVMIHYHLPEQVSSAWLLTVSSPWLRLAHPQGVIWVPLTRVSYAEIRQATSVQIPGEV